MRTRVVWLTAAFFIVFMGFSPSHAQDVVNLLVNGGFEDGVVDPWYEYGGATLEVVQQLVGATVPEDPIEGDYCLHVVVPNAGANMWDFGLKQPGLVWEAGKKYTLSAFVKCNEGTLDINFKNELDQDPYTAYGEQTFTMTDEWTEFYITSSVFTEEVNPGAITFHIGFDAGDFWIDGVRFYEGDYVPSKTFSEFAASPSPDNEADDVRQDVVMSWAPGEFADTHDIYFGTVYDDVSGASRTNPLGVLVGPNQDANTYDPENLLEFGQTYYWRVDEVSAPPDSTIFKGMVWSFTAKPFAYPVENITATASSFNSPEEGPENTINGSGLDSSGLLHDNDSENNMWQSSPDGAQPTWIRYEFDKIYKLHEMWVWNFNESWEPYVGVGFKDVTIEYSLDGNNYTKFGTTHEFAQAPGTDDYPHNTPIGLGGVVAQYVRLTANNNWGDDILKQYGLSEVRFLYVPVRARGPNPASPATGVHPDVTLSFRAGREAASHKVYFSTSRQAVIEGTAYVGAVTEATYDAGTLDLDETYYWKIEEVNEAETPTTWEGDVWSFTIAERLIVDDFESYGDGIEPGPPPPPGNRIWYTWKDGVGWETPPPGWEGNGTGSTVDLATSPVHGDLQSIPFNYINNGSTDKALYSEIERTFEPPQNWTAGRVRSLTLWFYGTPDNDAGATEQMYVKVNGAKVPYPGDMSDITQESWQPCDIPLKDFSDAGADLTNVTTLAIGFGDEANTTPGGSGTVYFDDIGLYGPRCLLSGRSTDFAKADYAPVGNPSGDCVIDYRELEIMARDWLAEDDIIATTTPSSAGLVAYYPLDEGTGTTAADASGNGHDGTLGGNATWVSPGLMGNAAVYIDGGEGSRVGLGTWDPSAGTGQLTLSIWTKWAGLHGGSDHQGLIGKRNAWAATDAMRFFFEISTDADDALSFRQYWEAGVDVYSPGGTMTPHIGRWAHTAVTFDGTTARIYLNGKEIASGPFALADKADAGIAIGCTHNEDSSSETYYGDLDEARIYNRALSPAEIAYLADTTPGDGQLHVRVPSPAELYEGEAQGSRAVNFKDFAVLATIWLDEQFWP